MAIRSWIRRMFKNGVSAVDYVPAGFSSSALSFVAHDGSTFPDGSVGSFVITVDQGLATEEKILIASRSGATFTIAALGDRGYNGGTAQTHGANATILHTIDAQDLDEANQVAVQTLGAIQATGDLLQGSGANGLVRLARGANSTFLQVSGTSLAYVAFGVSQSQAVGSANADGTQTSPARSDHAHAGVTSFNGTQGAVTGVASLNGGTGALSQTNGYGITGASSNPPVPAVALTSAAGHLTSQYNVTGSLATFLTTASLAAGTWLVHFTGLVGQGAAGVTEITTAAGTATATLEGAYSSEFGNNIAGTFEVPVALTFIATVTVTGTLVFQAKLSAGTPNIAAVTPNSSFANATGYTAVRIA